jgi:hypothetical protein
MRRLLGRRLGQQRFLGLSAGILTLALALAVVVPAAQAQVGAASGAPVHTHPIVSQSLKNDVSPPLRSIPGRPSQGKGHNADDFPQLRPVPAGRPNHETAYLQNHQVPQLIPSAGNNFDGVGNGFTGPNGTFTVNAAPPDTNGAVGPQDYVQTVNTDFAVFN